MFTLTNLSNNTLTLTKGRITPGESVTRESLGEKERSHNSRGWLGITDEEKIEAVTETRSESSTATTTEAPKAEAKNTKKPDASPVKED